MESVMNQKAIAEEMAELMLHGWHLWLARERQGGGQHIEVTVQEIEAFLRERCANLAMALPALILNDDEKELREFRRQTDRSLASLKQAYGVDADTAWDRLSRVMNAEGAVQAAIEAEGTPAVKDTFGAFMRATDDLMREAEKIQRVAIDEITALRTAVFGVRS
jgi:hypothetical protein